MCAAIVVSAAIVVGAATAESARKLCQAFTIGLRPPLQKQGGW
jgi:hypothetical protein